MDRRIVSRPIFIVCVIVGAAVGAYVAYWLALTAELRERTSEWIAARQTEGYTIEHGALRRRGFPFRARIEVDSPSIMDAGPEPKWAWGGGRADVSLPILRPNRLIIDVLGRQALAIGGDASLTEYVGEAETMRLELQPSGWLPNGRLTLRNLVMDARTGTDGFAIAQLDGWAAGDPQMPSNETEPGFRLTISVADMRPSAALALPLANTLERAIIEAELIGSLAPAPWPQALMVWRDAGGTIEINTFAIVYGPLNVTGKGTIALDRSVQPVGAMVTQIRGFHETINALAASGVINAQTAQTLNSVFRVIARPSDTGAGAEIDLPLSLQDRVLSAGPIPLVTFPKLQWGDQRADTSEWRMN